MTNPTCVTVDATTLTEAQRDGLACIRCSAEAATMRPVGIAAGHGQVFECSPACSDAETAQPGNTCKPWCVTHSPDSEGGICHATDLPGPDDVEFYQPGHVRMGHDSQDGTLIHLHCKVDELTPAEADQLGRSLLAQVAVARRTDRRAPATTAAGCPSWCVADHHGEGPDQPDPRLTHYSSGVVLPLSLPQDGGQAVVDVEQADDADPAVLIAWDHPVLCLTPGEVLDLTRSLMQAHTLASGPERSAEGCPAWCKADHANGIDVEHESDWRELVDRGPIDGEYVDVASCFYQQPGEAAVVALSIATPRGGSTAELTPDEAIKVALGLLDAAITARAAGSR
ncbi:hypothetical protein AB0K48_29570 [Nonomuraea sp. NPDC055795]